jgi:Icc-related predicted phosphoesterase
VIRIAAVGDLHASRDSAGTIRPQLHDVADRADVLLVAGDLTKRGTPEEGSILATELRELGLPVFAVLGNHDHHSGRPGEVREAVEAGGVTVLEGEGAVVEVDGTRLGVAGAKGFGGGFAGKSATEFGEEEMKAFVRHTRSIADRLHEALADLDADLRVVLLHYAPVPDTLQGEPPEIYPFLGSYLLAEAIDAAGADLILHGHAHRGAEKGCTPGGIPVRNVALHVLRRPYTVYRLETTPPGRKP